jgi:hypothetical protein
VPVSKSISPSRLLLTAALAVALAVLAAGCGGTTIDPAKLEPTAKQSLEHSLHRKIAAVDCPSGVDVDPGRVFECEVVFADKSREEVVIKIRNSDADVSLLGLRKTGP